MGRLPAYWADRPILDRFPYSMSGDLNVTENMEATQYPQATFQSGVDKPFEVHRMIPYCVAYTAEDVPIADQPPQELMLALVKMSVLNVDLDTLQTKNPTRIRSLLKGTSEMTWEFADPQYIVRSGGWQVDLQSDAFPATDPWDGISYILVTITLEGFLCIVGPPTNNR